MSMLLNMGYEQIGDIAFFWADGIGIVLLILLCRFLEKRSLDSMGFVPKHVFRNYITGLAIGFTIISAVVVIGLTLGAFQFIGISDSINPIFLLLYLSGFMIQGMYEEVLCRGFMMVSIARKSPVVVAILANSIFFGLIHMGNNGFSVLPMVNLILFGLFASVLFLSVDNIWIVGAVHTIWNFSMGCIYGLSVSGMDPMPSILMIKATEFDMLNGGAFGPEGGLIVTGVLLVGIAIVSWGVGKRETAEIMVV